jgi:putative addiction module component (TIGR02574 family)
MAVEKILQEALALPVKERSELAAALLRSIEPEDDEVLTEAEWEAAWAAELARRAKDIDEGRAQLIPAEEVFAELRARFPPR